MVNSPAIVTTVAVVVVFRVVRPFVVTIVSDVVVVSSLYIFDSVNRRLFHFICVYFGCLKYSRDMASFCVTRF